jgi:hypothetical protein
MFYSENPFLNNMYTRPQPGSRPPYQNKAVPIDPKEVKLDPFPYYVDPNEVIKTRDKVFAPDVYQKQAQANKAAGTAQAQYPEFVRYDPQQYNPFTPYTLRDNPMLSEGNDFISGQLKKAAMGQVPSAAELQMRDAIGRQLAAGSAMARSQPGVAPGLALALAGRQANTAMSEAATQTGILRAQEQAKARDQYAGWLGEYGRQDLAGQNMMLNQSMLQNQLASAQTTEANRLGYGQTAQENQLNTTRTSEANRLGLARDQMYQQAALQRESMRLQQIMNDENRSAAERESARQRWWQLGGQLLSAGATIFTLGLLGGGRGGQQTTDVNNLSQETTDWYSDTMNPTPFFDSSDFDPYYP